MSPNQKAAIGTARFLSAAVVVGGIAMFFIQESARTVRHCASYAPGCHVDPMPWGGIVVAICGVIAFVATVIYARSLNQIEHVPHGARPPAGL